MAELTHGAIVALLGIIHNELKALGRVKGDVEFIKEEMESIDSFLQHLAKTRGDKDDQVRAWMKAVREIAYICSDTIDLYVMRGNPAFHRNSRPLGLRCLGWIPSYLQKMAAQNRAADMLREIKIRVRDIGERRLRYGVVIPERIDDEEGNNNLARLDDSSIRPYVFAEPTSFREECKQELLRWLLQTQDMSHEKFVSIAVTAPDEKDREAIGALFDDDSVRARFHYIFFINFTSSLSAGPGLPAGPLDILEGVMKNLVPNTSDDERVMIEEKIAEIKENIRVKLEVEQLELEPLDILSDAIPEQWLDQDQGDKIEVTAMKMKKHMESRSWPVGLDHEEYVRILRKLLPQHTEKEEKPTNEDGGVDKLGGDHQITNNIREIMNNIEEAMHKYGDQEYQTAHTSTEKITVNKLHDLLLKIMDMEAADKKKMKKKKKDTDEHRRKAKESMDNIDGVLRNLKEVLITRIAKKINDNMENNKRTLVFLRDMDYLHTWEKIREALNCLTCAAGSAVVVTTKYTQGSEQFCNPAREPILCSLAGSYHKKVLRIVEQPNCKAAINYNTSIFREILERCEPHEFCMKIFVRALYANPIRSKEEVTNLLDSLISGEPSRVGIAKQMTEFSYDYLPQEYKSCFLFLAIFRKEENKKINRSRLVGRWVVEDLIRKDDWPSSVRRAEQCIDELVDRCFLLPVDISATGKVKSFQVDTAVHEVITAIAKGKSFVNDSLAPEWAQHFSIDNDVCLGSSDTMERFWGQLDRSPQLSRVKVLDLQGCRLIGKGEHYLKFICNKMLLLKYLCLRDTSITMLPKEIGNLYLLEILDIRQTNVLPFTTKDITFLKLKRLLAGKVHYPSKFLLSGQTDGVHIPREIENMTSMEVLSTVEASGAGHDLNGIRLLRQLRKLGVIINDKADCLDNFLGLIGYLNECIQSLSVSFTPLKRQGTSSNKDLPEYISRCLTKHTKILESLSISGYTSKGQLLPLLIKEQQLLAKVTLRHTFLNQNYMEVLATLSSLRSLRLGDRAYSDSKFTFDKGFQNLEYLLIEGSNMKDITFEAGASPQLNKIVLSSTNMDSFSGIVHLHKLQELNLYGECILDEVKRDIEEQQPRLVVKQYYQGTEE